MSSYLEQAGLLYAHEIQKQPFKKRDTVVIECHNSPKQVTDIRVTPFGDNYWAVESATTTRTYNVTWGMPFQRMVEMPRVFNLPPHHEVQLSRRKRRTYVNMFM